ncbi:MAG: hypothetical protein RLY13_583 [Actinomycetota bacterium]|jgi:uncharacterized protein YneF (UPF0154 family)
MTNVPLPVLIGTGMIIAGLGLGIYIAVKAVSASRHNDPID